MRVLGCILMRTKKGGFISGFKVGGRGDEVMKVSYLLFNKIPLFSTMPIKEQIGYLS